MEICGHCIMCIQRCIDLIASRTVDSAAENSGLSKFKHAWNIKMKQRLLLVGDHAPEWALADEQGTIYTLAGIQEQKPAVLTLLRHFG